jgi:hypothetical protein
MKHILLGLMLLFTIATKAQVGVGTATPETSAKFEVSSTTKGFLPPRMSHAQKNAIASPVAGLTVWCTDCGLQGEMQVYNGLSWTNMIGGNGRVPLAIGENYGGGKVAYIFQSGDPGFVTNQTHGFIVSTSDISASAPWWNGVAYTLTNATGTALGTGLTNTNAIIASQGNSGSYAAKLCADYSVTVDGVFYDDWYFPSMNELDKIYLNKGLIGGSFSNYYWSSTESSQTNARVQNFLNGLQTHQWKDPAYAVRAIRSF